MTPWLNQPISSDKLQLKLRPLLLHTKLNGGPETAVPELSHGDLRQITSYIHAGPLPNVSQSDILLNQPHTATYTCYNVVRIALHRHPGV